MRIVQVIPQMFDLEFSLETVSQIGFATDSPGRMPLGVVPVEADGSVYCEAPVGKALYFQLLDEQGMAVHSMRSATYVHPGEQLVCQGCHEDKWRPRPRPPRRADGAAAAAVEDRAGSGQRRPAVQLHRAGQAAGVRRASASRAMPSIPKRPT